MKMQRSILAPIMVAVIALASGGWFLQRGASQERNVYYQARLFEEVVRHIADRYVDRKEPSDLYRMAIDGLLTELGDPHSAFMTPDDYNRLRVQTQGEYGGLGIEIDVRDGWLTVVSPLPGTPAERAGLRAGDRIIEVDGRSTRGWTSDDGVANLRGPKGKAVDLRIVRVGVQEPIPFRIVRDEIQIKAVQASYLTPDGVGYIWLGMFNDHATEEVRRAIDELRGQNMRGLILDLRGNPGGLLEQGIAMSDLFLERGQVIAEMRSRMSSQNQRATASRGDRYQGLPVIVLVEPNSASASEILAGALQDHDRAVVIGRTTFGKGSVQTLFPLAAGNYLKLTTARWYTPLGRSIHRQHDDAEPLFADADDPAAPAAHVETERPEETFRTPSGRVVYGGGGIHPDLIVTPTPFAEAEREFARVIGPKGPTFTDALYRYSLAYTHQNPNLREGFPITPRMLDDFYATLRESGIDVPRELYDDASGWISRELAFRISYTAWGRPEARKRYNVDDDQFRLAHQILMEANDPPSLLVAAERHRARIEADAGGVESPARASASGGRRP